MLDMLRFQVSRLSKENASEGEDHAATDRPRERPEIKMLNKLRVNSDAFIADCDRCDHAARIDDHAEPDRNILYTYVAPLLAAAKMAERTDLFCWSSA
jgi:hypothetical protein